MATKPAEAPIVPASSVASPATAPLLEPGFLRKLERLALGAERAPTARLQGERRTTRRGASLEFADYREYTAGDDLRYVDWKAYARLDRLFVKLFVAEEDLGIHLLLDASESMNFVGNEGSSAPAPALNKFAFARKAVAALGYVGLMRYDRVGVTGFAQGGSLDRAMGGRRTPTLRGRRATTELFGYLQNLRPGGRTDFSTALQDYARRASTPGVCVVASDFMDPHWEKGVKALLARRFQVVLLHVLSPEEMNPTLSGDLRLVDSETGAVRDVSITPDLIVRYKAALQSFCDRMEAVAAKYGMEYIRTTTDTPVEELLLSTLRRSGLLR
ncbi:MAG: DUF58 domain-containing protein [Armatimonadetes bacterium]|nr:DUF58 domain-containing protein [Armatimonadota bacterium]